ncbi:hypothetical protein SKAU_G00221630 [Synaphobranchus kaupii]|uniref:Uncharacterized protein n=1 Tax=Synaphobranchus kaupii TaxID=118154 RepID=A0A9Q1FAX0_SYNKA|nr:hypothetical protein SKAU_G00221630 [Synaphobranchus kaupii]
MDSGIFSLNTVEKIELKQFHGPLNTLPKGLTVLVFLKQGTPGVFSAEYDIQLWYVLDISCCTNVSTGLILRKDQKSRNITTSGFHHAYCAGKCKTFNAFLTSCNISVFAVDLICVLICSIMNATCELYVLAVKVLG